MRAIVAIIYRLHCLPCQCSTELWKTCENCYLYPCTSILILRVNMRRDVAVAGGFACRWVLQAGPRPQGFSGLSAQRSIPFRNSTFYFVSTSQVIMSALRSIIFYSPVCKYVQQYYYWSGNIPSTIRHFLIRWLDTVVEYFFFYIHFFIFLFFSGGGEVTHRRKQDLHT